MSVLRFKNKKYFKMLLKIFADRKQVTFDIKKDFIRISSLYPPYFHLRIPNSLYEINVPIEFTIDIKDLLINIELLDTDLAILDQTFDFIKFGSKADEERFISECYNKSVCVDEEGDVAVCGDADTSIYPRMSIAHSTIRTPLHTHNLSHTHNPHLSHTNDLFSIKTISFIKIPFISPLKSYYNSNNSFSTRCFVDKNTLRYFLHGNVIYSNDRCLVLRKGEDGSDEMVRVEVEYLREGFLYFYCSNEWLVNISHYINLVSNVLFCFTEGMLSVKMLFNGQKDLFLEIQVPEKVRADI